MTIVRRLVRLWLAVVIAGGLAPMPIAGTGVAARVQSTKAALPEYAALASSRPMEAARLSRAELRADAASRSTHKAFDVVVDGHGARVLAAAGRASVGGHLAAADIAPASTLSLRGPPRSA